jgi:tetratricopeptide (TPR) repeat protein
MRVATIRVGVTSGLAILLGFSAAAVQTPQADPDKLQRYVQEGERALAEKRYTDAQKSFEALRDLSPQTAEVHARLGLIYFQQGKFADAVPTLRQALRLKPALPNLDALLAMSLSELGGYEEALPMLEKTFRKSDDAVLKRMTGLHLQRAYTGLGRDREAVEVVMELSRLHPDDPEVLYHSGRVLANFAYLQTVRLAQVAPGSVWRHQAAAEANESQGLYDAAITEYRRVLALDPDRPGMHFRLGRALLARGRQSGGDVSGEIEARSAFERELRIDPTNANAAYELGELHRKAGELEAALELFRAAVRHDGDFDEALVGLARTLAASGRAQAAIEPLRKAASLKPDNEVIYYHLARAYGALGNKAEQDKALAEYRRLRELKAQKEEQLLMRPEVTQQTVDQHDQKVPEF